MAVITYRADEIGIRLVKIREKNQMTQKQVANYLNVSIRTIARYEHGEIALGIETIMDLCQLFRVSADYFLFGVERILDLPEEDISEKIIRLQGRLNEEEKQKLYHIMQILFL